MRDFVQGALADAEEAIRKSASLDVTTLLPYITRFVNVKLQSESIKDALWYESFFFCSATQKK